MVTATSAWSGFASSASLLILGALLTGLLVPSITRRWQNHQKELDLKVDLLHRISEQVTRVVTHAAFTKMGAKDWGSPSDRTEFDWQIGEWLVATRSLQSDLQAYFQLDPEIHLQWARYCDVLRAVHELSWPGDYGGKAKQDALRSGQPPPDNHPWECGDQWGSDDAAARRTDWCQQLELAYSDRQLWRIATGDGRSDGDATPRVFLGAPRVIDFADLSRPCDFASGSEAFDRFWPPFRRAIEAPMEPLTRAIAATRMTPLNATVRDRVTLRRKYRRHAGDIEQPIRPAA
jgi:hypothetical protein